MRVSPLPLAGDGSARFLPWLVALMVFLAAVATCAAFAIGSALERWDSGLRGTFTVQLPGEAGAAPGPDKVEAVLALLRSTPGVSSADALDPAATARLLQPWLGDSAALGALPIPVLIDLHAAPDAGLDTHALEARLGTVAPGATVEQHGPWLDQLFRTARLIEVGAAAVVALIAAVAVTAVVFTTRTGLALHASLIELLHLMGATDETVAREFQRHAFRLGFRGGLLGLLMTLLAFGALKLAAESGGGSAGTDLMPGFRLPLAAWAAVAVLPLVMGAVAFVTARVTVLRTLGRLA